MSEHDGRTTLDPDLRSRLREILRSHPVSLAMVFGSTVRNGRPAEDLDLAIEFDELRPSDAGYSTTYLRLRSDLNDALGTDVDLVDVHSMSPQFAGSVFDHAELVVGSEQRRSELEDELELASPSVSEARDRIADAARRLREGES